MATTICANLETNAVNLLLHSAFLRPCGRMSSSLAVVPSWKSKSLGVFGSSGHWKCKGFSGATRGAVASAYRNLDSELSRDIEEEISTRELLCCPICFKPLSRDGPEGLTQYGATFELISFMDRKLCENSIAACHVDHWGGCRAAINRSGFSCKSCRKGFVNKDVYLDLTILEGSKVYDESSTIGSEMFRSPLIAFLYERGWRNTPLWASFPGPDEEFKMAQDYFQPVMGGVLIDVSCGSGLFTRRFARSRDYKSVVALDFSESMLRESAQFIKQDASLATTSNIALVRADVARLPFATGSIDAVHAGAAIHCWPSPAAGMAEISRILKPGGVFVGSTFLQYSIPDFGIRDVRKAIKGVLNSSTIHYFEEVELEELCGTCGLVEYSRIRRGQYIMFSAKRAEDIQA